MKVHIIPMDEFAQSREGKIILQVAFQHNATNITQRLMPTNNAEDRNGLFMVMLLDWPNGMIVRVMFNADEIQNLATAVTALAGLDALDAYETEGATIH